MEDRKARKLHSCRVTREKASALDASIISVDGQVEKLAFIPAEARKIEIKIYLNKI